MKILVLGADGYLGWPTCLHFSARGHEVRGLDSGIKRVWEEQCGVKPLWPMPSAVARAVNWAGEINDENFDWYQASLLTADKIYSIMEDYQPDVVIHYAEQPSAPYSMSMRRRAVETQQNNIIGTMNLIFAIAHGNPDCHLIKLGTMGEYGTPNIPIEEGWIDVESEGRRDRLPFPKQPGSFYHCSKVADSTNIQFACRAWGLRATDLNQGVVYGIETPEIATDPSALRTSFHYDAIFGTVLNRFLVQAAIGQPLTVYGKGGQTRGFLNIQDTMKCVELAALNPPAAGEYRVFNQMTERFSINDLAVKVQVVSGRKVKIDHIPNPRVESEDHYYKVRHTALTDLGLNPVLLDYTRLKEMYETIQAAVDEYPPDETALQPDIKWRQS